MFHVMLRYFERQTEEKSTWPFEYNQSFSNLNGFGSGCTAFAQPLIVLQGNHKQ